MKGPAPGEPWIKPGTFLVLGSESEYRNTACRKFEMSETNDSLTDEASNRPSIREILFKELSRILAAHRKWVATNREEGSRADLREVNLCKASLLMAYLQWADLQGANLQGANLQWAKLQGANLQWGELSLADLLKADLRGANLQGANLDGANLP